MQAEWDAPTVVGGAGARFRSPTAAILDMSSLAECSNLGHQHPRVVRAIREQAERLCFVTNAWGAEPRAALAARLLEMSGFAGGRVFFTLGGADANEHAVKFARQAAGRPHGIVITRDRSYHGATYLAMALSGDARTRAQVDPDALGVGHVPPPYAYRCPFGSRTTTSAVSARRGRRERIDRRRRTGRGRPDGAERRHQRHRRAGQLLAGSARATPRNAASALIADEVMSGFGRCGEWFAWQRYGEAGRPDLMTLAKGLTGAAPAARRRRAVARDRRAARARDALHGPHLLRPSARVRRGRRGDRTPTRTSVSSSARARSAAPACAELERLQARHPVIGDVRGGHGLFAVVELVADRATREPLAPWPETPPALKALVDARWTQGVSFGARGNLILLAPPLVIDERDLADALALLDRLLGEFFPAQ